MKTLDKAIGPLFPEPRPTSIDAGTFTSELAPMRKMLFTVEPLRTVELVPRPYLLGMFLGIRVVVDPLAVNWSVTA